MPKFITFLLFAFLVLCGPCMAAQDAPLAKFGDWNVSVIDTNTDRYIRLWTRVPDTSIIFEITLTRNRGYRYYEPQDSAEVSFVNLVEPVVYKQAYASADEVKKVGEFSLDELLYPVGLLNQDTTGDLVSQVYNLPDNFLQLLSGCEILAFRQVSGVNYMISLDGFRDALAYANTLRNDYNDPSRHPCYPLIPTHKANWPVK